MKAAYQVASPPTKPLMVFDGDCNFCRVWIRRWQHTTEDRLDYLPFQDASITARFPEIPREQLETAVHLVESDGTVYTGAEAAFRALAHNPHEQWFLDWYIHSTVFARTSERAYRFVANHRRLFSTITRWLWGEHVEPPQHILVRWLFLRSIAIIYLIAFISLWSQIIGLVGENGILPAKSTMENLQRQVAGANIGFERYHLFPTLCWFSASDRSLQIQCALGVVLSVLLLVGFAPAPCLFLLWLIYLSLSTISREFLSFQWDILLLEIGFLAMFFAPLTLLPRWVGRASSRTSVSEKPVGIPRLARTLAPPSRTALWLLRWLLFCLMFQSGCVKLLSGDPTWHNLTALTFHYETQPLPTWIGWYAYQLPVWFQKSSTVLMFGTELAIPFLIFAPRRLRFLGCAALIALQIFILLTGNYCFFNLLTITLCFTLFDDAFLLRFVPRNIVRVISSPQPSTLYTRFAWLRRILTFSVAFLLLGTSLLQFSSMFRLPIPWPNPIMAAYEWLSPFRTFSSYGLFAVMTTSRPEIVVEGSNDGVTWFEYEFKYKPGDLKRRPQFVAPHQPRLDWQMWFAALSDYRHNPWFVNFCVRLLQGSPEVLALLERNPFPNAPPRYIRAVVYDYHFTNFATRRKTGAWWRRELKGDYLPAISLRREDGAP